MFRCSVLQQHNIKMFKLFFDVVACMAFDEVHFETKFSINIWLLWHDRIDKKYIKIMIHNWCDFSQCYAPLNNVCCTHLLYIKDGAYWQSIKADEFLYWSSIYMSEEEYIMILL